MKNQLRIYTGIGSIFIWIGFVLAISFMEAWLKFQAPGVTLAIGLSIGRIVFGALNIVEWILVSILIISVYPYLKSKTVMQVIYCFVIVLLGIQTWYLLPILDARAIMQIEGQAVGHSYAHIVYVLIECIKIAMLFYLSLQTIRTTFTHSHQ